MNKAQEKRKNADDYMVGDYVLLTLPKKFDTVRLVDWDVWGDIKKQGTELDDFEGKAKYYWLPTLEQLFGIWCSLCETTNFAGLCQRIINRKSKLVTYPNIKFVKLLCLEAIMKEFYNKQWNGKGWDVIE